MKKEFEVYKKKRGDEYGWRFKLGDEILAVGKQYFAGNKIREALYSAMACVHGLRANQLEKPTECRGPYFTVFNTGKRWYWHNKAANYKIVASSPKHYSSATEAWAAVRRYVRAVKSGGKKCKR